MSGEAEADAAPPPEGGAEEAPETGAEAMEAATEEAPAEAESDEAAPDQGAPDEAAPAEAPADVVDGADSAADAPAESARADDGDGGEGAEAAGSGEEVVDGVPTVVMARRASEVPEQAAGGGVSAAGEENPASPSDGTASKGKMLFRSSSKLIIGELRKRRTQTVESQNAVDDADEKADAEEAKWKMPVDFFYADDSIELQPDLPPNELPRTGAKAVRFLGFDFHRHYNLTWLSDHEFAYVTGHVVCIVDLNRGDTYQLHGRDSGGIGSIALSHDGTYFAVGEKSLTPGVSPNVYIYVKKSHKLYRILRKGTENAYASVEFSPHNKNQLAALGCAPDYLLSVWDWRNERLLLKCKAYGQDVYAIRWGQFPGQLISCGTGHIRFWKMATTFTGLKLQGALGKFGATELSDIVGFVELPDGKIVTGTEYGRLLLWEGNFVKVELMRYDEEKPNCIGGVPHTGSIEVIMLDSETNCVVSGGEDGYLRWWPIDEIDLGEADYDQGLLEYGVHMQREVRIPPEEGADGFSDPAHIQHVATAPDGKCWLVQDLRNGVVWKYDRESGQCSMIVQSHAKQVTGALLVEPFPGLAISSGVDGTLRAFNVSAERENTLFMDRRSNSGGVSYLTAAPESVDAEKRTVLAGYMDGTIRVFSVCIDGFALMQALKPHNCLVKHLEYSPDGRFIASLGADNTVFFFEVRGLHEHAAPIGFVQLHAQVNHLAWHPTMGRALLSLEDGSIAELVVPTMSHVDNSESFLIEVSYRAIMPEVPELQDEEEAKKSTVEGEEEGEGGEQDGEGEAAEGDDLSPKNNSAAPEPEKDEEDDEGEGPKAVEVPTTVSRAVYLEDGVGFVGTGRYSSALWQLDLESVDLVESSEQPFGQGDVPALEAKPRTRLPKGVPVTHMSISPSSRFLFVGYSDGRCWAIPFKNMSLYSCLTLADSTTGAITSISSDSSEQMLVAAGGDGSLSAVTFNSTELLALVEAKAEEEDLDDDEVAEKLEDMMPELPHGSPDDWEMPPLAAVPATPMDITDPKYYSIQDMKLKSEQDSAQAAANQQKARIRERIAEVRQELEDLMAKNASNPLGKLTSEELIVDQEHIQYLREQMEHRVEDVNTELAWSVEFHERGVQKLKEHYLDQLDFERVEVLGFRSPHRVSTFRCQSMTEELQESLAKLHELIFAADRESDDEDGAGGDGSPKNPADHLQQEGGFGEDGYSEEASGTAKQNTSFAAAQREARRQLRNSRKEQMQELERTKPSDSYEDPQDVEAIARAEATLGNYLLKTSDSYQVPENQRMNAEKKRRQMSLLEESMHAIKTEFNHRVISLRDFRLQVGAEVQRDIEALKEIDSQLGSQTAWLDGLLDKDPLAPPEFPERRLDYTDAELKAFGRRLRGEAEEEVPAEEAEEEEAEEDEEEGEDDGSEDFDDDGEEDEEEDADAESGEGDEKEAGRRRRKRRNSEGKAAKDGGEASGSQPAAPVSGRSALAARRIARLTLRAKVLQSGPRAADALGRAVAEEAEARLWHDKAQLEEHIRQVIDTFNNAVASIEKEKAKLESDLKNADMKLLVLYEELLTLNELEEKDEALLKKATKCRQDKTSIMHQIKECQDQLGEKKTEIEQWHSEEQMLQAEFTELVGENTQFFGALLKIYKKKVKRSKRKKGVGEDEDFDEDEDDEEEESDMESEEDEDEMDDEGPPPGCDVQIYESVIDLREKRLDMEDALQEIQKAVDELRKTHKKLLDDEKRIDKEQKQTDSEIQQFQTDKQRKLNQVEIVFALRLSQVQCLDQPPAEEEEAPLLDGPQKLPAELDRHVVFTHEGLQRLMRRIEELHQEIKEVKSGHKQLQRDYRLQKKEKNQVLKHIEELQGKYQDIQMLKFGQTVDLDLIERSAPNTLVQELQGKARDVEFDHRDRIAQWEKKIEKQKKDMAKVTQDNTSLMEQIVSMGYSQMQLDAALNARIANVTVNDNEPIIELREMERERLKDLLMLQQKEIATLQAEINLFRRKGGHIYTTVTANRATVAN